MLTGLLSSISANPQAYDRASWHIRVAKSRQFGLTIPMFRIFFQILYLGERSRTCPSLLDRRNRHY